MTTNFTFRDFLVYLMTGLLVIITLGTIYFRPLFEEIVHISTNYAFLKDYSALLIIFLIPVVYIMGHMVNAIDFILLKCFVWLHPVLKGSKYWRWALAITEFLFYRHRIAFQIVKHWKSNLATRAFDTTEGFWVLCAKLQKEKNYENAGYWYTLNDLFKAIYVIFFVACIITVMEYKWTQLAVFFVLLTISKIRAYQFASFFVNTVIRSSRN